MPKIFELGVRCCGCGACAAVCPKGAIAMIPDGAGFLRPLLDTTACIGCGMCDQICPALNERGADGCEAVWWARAEDGVLLARSSSGGLFGLLARRTLDGGGATYGAAYADDFKSVRHVRVGSPDGLDAVMRSKYVQSAVGPKVYRGVEADLRAGLPVLFAGTACQVSGMRGYLEARRVPMESLLLVEVICHGVPSPHLWSEWAGYRERLARGTIRAMNFRSKTAGWQSYSVRYSYRTEKDDSAACVESSPFGDDWYMRAFLHNASLRGSCLACPAKRSCGSDVTLGDFWGVQGKHPEAFDDRGVSAVIANTARGREAVEALGDALAKGESSFDSVVAGNPALLHSVAPFRERDAFLDAVAGGASISELVQRWDFEPSFRDKLVAKVRRVGGKVKRAVKRVIGRG